MYLHILFYFAAKRWNSRMRTNAMYSFIRLQKQNLFQSYADVTTFIFVCVTVQANNMMFSHIFYFFFFFWWRWGSDHCKHAHYAFCVTGLANVRNYIVSGHPCSRQCVGTPALCTAAIFFFRYSLFFFFDLLLFLQLFYFIFCLFYKFLVCSGCVDLHSLPNQMRPYFSPTFAYNCKRSFKFGCQLFWSNIGNLNPSLEHKLIEQL